jgi:hypothetical protein
MIGKFLSDVKYSKRTVQKVPLLCPAKPPFFVVPSDSEASTAHPVLPSDSEASPTHLVIIPYSSGHFERSEKSPL